MILICSIFPRNNACLASLDFFYEAPSKWVISDRSKPSHHGTGEFCRKTTTHSISLLFALIYCPLSTSAIVHCGRVMKNFILTWQLKDQVDPAPYQPSSPYLRGGQIGKKIIVMARKSSRNDIQCRTEREKRISVRFWMFLVLSSWQPRGQLLFPFFSSSFDSTKIETLVETDCYCKLNCLIGNAMKLCTCVHRWRFLWCRFWYSKQYLILEINAPVGSVLLLHEGLHETVVSSQLFSTIWNLLLRMSRLLWNSRLGCSRL